MENNLMGAIKTNSFLSRKILGNGSSGTSCKVIYFLLTREGRKGIDVVNDNVENSLMREVDNIKVFNVM
jgi:hypothetical protein